MTELAKVLIVDDEANLLSGLRRQLRSKYDLTTASSGDEALDRISHSGPFAVVVSDMRMPGMDGVELLDAISTRAPMTVRMMLTGNADQETAVKAINTGHIFRFFNKPCDAETLSSGIDEGVIQYRLQQGEKELIESTLTGSVMLLSDVLSLANPRMVLRRDKMRGWAKKLAKEIEMPRAWELDLAVMMGAIGSIGIPPAILEKVEKRAPLSDEERKVYETMPKLSADLVAHIPRLENVAKGLLYQSKNYDGSGFPDDTLSGAQIPMIGRVMRILNDIADSSGGAEPGRVVFEHLQRWSLRYDPAILAAAERVLLADTDGDGEETSFRSSEYVPVRLLRRGLLLVDDIAYPDGRLILSKGTELTEVQVQRIRAIHKVRPVAEPILVSFPLKT